MQISTGALRGHFCELEGSTHGRSVRSGSERSLAILISSAAACCNNRDRYCSRNSGDKVQVIAIHHPIPFDGGEKHFSCSSILYLSCPRYWANRLCATNSLTISRALNID